MTTDTTSTPLPQDVYWASVDRERLADTIRAKALYFRKQLEDDGRYDLLQRATRTFYGLDAEGGFANSAAVTYGGDSGEQIMVRVNHFHSIIQGLHAIACKERPRFEARALSTDTEALGQARLATALIGAYYRDIGLEEIQEEVGRMAIVLGEGFTALRWNPSLGKVTQTKTRPVYDDSGAPIMEEVEQTTIDEATGEVSFTMEMQPKTETVPMREGDVEAQVFSPIEVIRDLETPKRAMTWAILPYRENVWDLVARYPDRRVELLNLRQTAQRWPRTPWGQGPWDPPKASDDMITVWWLYHLPTDACPKGRHAIVAGDVVVYDAAMPLEEVPVYGCIPELEMGTAQGHSPQFDLLAIQQCTDSVFDTIISSHDALGMQNVIAPNGTKVTPTNISKGLQLLEYTPTADAPNNGKPEALQLLSISADSFKLLDIGPKLMETLSGLNSVARGDAPPNLKSGTALALVQSLAVAFNSNLQAAVVRHHEKVATGLLKLLQKFAKTTRTAEIAGRTKQSVLAQWSSDKISQVARIAVDIASPLMQTTAGKLQAAQDLLQNGKIATAQEYIEVLTTGNLEPMYESTLSRLTYLRAENEMMMEGKEPTVSAFDDHGVHVREHLGCLDAAEVRADKKLRQVVNDHVMEHFKMWQVMDPGVALLTGQSVMPLPPAITPPMKGADLGSHPGDQNESGGPPPPMVHGRQAGKAPKAAPLGKDGGPGMPDMPSPATPGGQSPNPVT